MQTTMRKKKRYVIQLLHMRGMSLVEMIIAVALFTLAMLMVTEGIHKMYQYNAYTFAQAYQVQNARIGMQSLIRDIREMTFADDGSFPLVVMEEDRIGFYSDIDRDNSVEYIEYELIDDTTLVKSVFNATGSPPVYDSTPDEQFTLSEYVQNNLQATSTFYYYDETGTAQTSAGALSTIRYIKAQIIVNIDPVRAPGEFMLRSSAALRNLLESL